MMGSVPNQPATPHMSFRIDPDLKTDVTHIAAARGEKVSTIVRQALEKYRNDNKGLLEHAE